MAGKCGDIAKHLLPDAEIRRAMDMHMEDGLYCLVDFKRRDVEADVDCDDYCFDIEREEEYDACVNECEETKSEAEVGSAIFHSETYSLREATLPGGCGVIYMPIDVDEEKWEKRKNEFIDKIRGLGCKFQEGWIHPHEIARYGYEVEEEPAICYYHVEAEKPGACRLPDVLKIIGEYEYQPDFY